MEEQELDVLPFMKGWIVGKESDVKLVKRIGRPHKSATPDAYLTIVRLADT